MAQYTVRHGQNLFDIVLTCYGDLNGLGDFMLLNPTVNYNSNFNDGDIVNYDETKVISQVTSNYYSKNRIIPTGGNDYIYYKEPLYKHLFSIYVSQDVVNLIVGISGSGIIQIDWGDNSQLQTVQLSQEVQTISHDSNSYLDTSRRIRFYGEADFHTINLSRINVERAFSVSDFKCLTLIINDNKIIPNIKFTKIIRNLNKVDFSRTLIDDLSPLLYNHELREIHLENCEINQSIIDEYVIGLVKNYQSRLLADVWMKGNDLPSGMYQEPSVLSDPQTGMEAIWVLENDVDRGWVFHFD